jgi:hypothetical protein
MFAIQHGLHLFVRERAHAGIDPADGFLKNLERLLVAAELVLVEQACIDFVEGIPGCPDSLARHHAVNQFFRIGTEIAARELGLTLGHARDDLRGLLLEFLIAAALVCQRTTGEIVPDRVSAQFAFGLFPAAILFG